jgi:hypothetical protein
MAGKYDHLPGYDRPTTRAFIHKSKAFVRKMPAAHVERIYESLAPPFKRKRKRAAPQVEIALRALRALFPDDKIPDQAMLPNLYLINMVRKWFKENGIVRPIHDISILRARKKII